MAELVDAHDSKSCDSNIVWVRFPPSALMLTIILGIVALIGYLYISWRTLRENYQEEDIIAFSWVGILLFLIGGRVSFGLFHWGIWNENPGAWLEFWHIGETNIWGAILLWIGFALLIIKDKNWKIWQFFEDSLPSIWFLLISDTLILKLWPILITVVVAMLLTMPMKSKYRSLQWYKSGRKGFLFFWFLIWFCLVFAAVSRLWWVASLSLLFMGGLFMLGNDKFSK